MQVMERKTNTDMKTKQHPSLFTVACHPHSALEQEEGTRPMRVPQESESTASRSAARLWSTSPAPWSTAPT